MQDVPILEDAGGEPLHGFKSKNSCVSTRNSFHARRMRRFNCRLLRAVCIQVQWLSSLFAAPNRSGRTAPAGFRRPRQWRRAPLSGPLLPSERTFEPARRKVRTGSGVRPCLVRLRATSGPSLQAEKRTQRLGPASGLTIVMAPSSHVAPANRKDPMKIYRLDYCEMSSLGELGSVPCNAKSCIVEFGLEPL